MAAAGVVQLQDLVSQLSCLCNGSTHAGKESSEPRGETNLCFSGPAFSQNLE